ncbi:MAG: CbbQ/NirQ/NorQ C-terminal domain-containing protein, partial [Betaproteobacteria bacterium]
STRLLVYAGSLVVAGLSLRDAAEATLVGSLTDDNWAGYGAEVALSASMAPEDRALLTDPQTSGGLLVSCEPGSVDEVLAVFKRHGFENAAVVGRVTAAGASPLVIKG